MSNKQRINKDRERIKELSNGIRYEMTNSGIAIEALQLANRYITKADNQREMLNQLKDKKPKAGKWVKKGTEQFYWYNCSECGNSPLFAKSNYCPSCGAKMEKEGKE